MGVVATVAAGVDVTIAARAVTTAVCVAAAAAAVCVAVIAVAAGAAVAVGVAAADYVAGGFAAAEERVGAAGLSGIGSVGCGHLVSPGEVHVRGTAAVWNCMRDVSPALVPLNDIYLVVDTGLLGSLGHSHRGTVAVWNCSRDVSL